MKISHPKVEGVFQASKWLTHRVLLDSEEMQMLLEGLPSFAIYNVSELVTMETMGVAREVFLAKYIDYVSELKAGLSPQEAVVKPIFSGVFSTSEEFLYAMQVKEEDYIVKLLQPVVQLSMHRFTFSQDLSRFHSMVNSEHAVSWGLQFSYPQLYSNSLQGDVVDVFKDTTNPNTHLFQCLGKWVRRETKPVPFLTQGKKIHATFRIGKKCFSWIDSHPHLDRVGLKVAERI